MHRRQTSGCSGCRCTRCFFDLVVLNKSRILLNKSRNLILHPHFFGPLGANDHACRFFFRVRPKGSTRDPVHCAKVMPKEAVMRGRLQSVSASTFFFTLQKRSWYQKLRRHPFGPGTNCQYDAVDTG